MIEAKGLEIFTLGHSNQRLEDFLALLREFDMRALVDIRRFPSSRKFPYFNGSNLRNQLDREAIGYFWLESLGGRRHAAAGKTSPNQGLENAAFRNYADHMATGEFRGGVEELLGITKGQRTAVMCAEKLFWNCHRRLLSDFLHIRGISVQHILGPGRYQSHRLTPCAEWDGKRVHYPLPLLAGATGSKPDCV